MQELRGHSDGQGCDAPKGGQIMTLSQACIIALREIAPQIGMTEDQIQSGVKFGNSVTNNTGDKAEIKPGEEYRCIEMLKLLLMKQALTQYEVTERLKGVPRKHENN
jgi:hypothetical protein